MTKLELQTAVYEAWVRNVELKGCDPGIGLAICHHESAWDPQARSPVTASDEKYGGAWGLCQILLDTAKELGFVGQLELLWEPGINAWLFSKLTARNVRKVGKLPVPIIAAHNCGPGHVVGRTIPDSTKNVYVPSVMALYEAHYRGWTPASPTAKPDGTSDLKAPSETSPSPYPQTETP